MWKDNITMDLRETGFDGIYWIHVVQDKDKWLALVSMVMNYWVQKNVWNFLASWATAGFSRRALLHAVSYFYIPHNTSISKKSEPRTDLTVTLPFCCSTSALLLHTGSSFTSIFALPCNSTVHVQSVHSYTTIPSSRRVSTFCRWRQYIWWQPTVSRLSQWKSQNKYSSVWPQGKQNLSARVCRVLSLVPKACS